MTSSSSPLRRGHTERKRSRDCWDFEPDWGTGVLTVADTVRVSCLETAVGTDIRDVDRCKWRSGMKSGMRKSGMSGRRAASHAVVGRIMQIQMQMQQAKTNADTNNRLAKASQILGRMSMYQHYRDSEPEPKSISISKRIL